MAGFDDTTSAVHIYQAPHVGPASRQIIDVCVEAVRPHPGLAHVAHYTGGILDFSADVLAAAHAGPPAGDDIAGHRRHLEKLGRQLKLTVERLDDWLQPLGNGRLIRTVFSSADGAIYHVNVRPGEYVVGAVRGRENIEAGDRLMAELSDGIRGLYRLGSENPGGFHGAGGELAAVPEARHRVWSSAKIDEMRAALRTLSERHISPLDLHYAGCQLDDSPVFTVDVLDHDDLAIFFTAVNADTRRKIYEELARRLAPLVRRLGYQLDRALGGALTRAVLDVEEGALYHRTLPDGEQLLCVTVDQSQVWNAERRLDALVADYASWRAIAR